VCWLTPALAQLPAVPLRRGGGAHRCGPMGGATVCTDCAASEFQRSEWGCPRAAGPRFGGIGLFGPKRGECRLSRAHSIFPEPLVLWRAGVFRPEVKHMPVCRGIEVKFAFGGRPGGPSLADRAQGFAVAIPSPFMDTNYGRMG